MARTRGEDTTLSAAVFTDILREETERRRLPAVTVTATMTEDDLTKRVAEVLGLHSHTR